MIFIDCGNINFSKLKKIEDLLIEKNLNDNTIINYLKSYKSKNVEIKRALTGKKYINYIKKADIVFVCDTKSMTEVMNYNENVFIISDCCTGNYSKFKNVTISEIPKTIDNFPKTKKVKVAKKSQKKKIKGNSNILINLLKGILKFMLTIILILLIMFLIYLCYNKYTNQKQITKKEKVNNEKIKGKIDYRYENYVFIGDSITEGYDTDKYYKDYKVVNTGVGGYTTDDLYDNLEKKLFIYNPTKTIMLIGTNDLIYKDDEYIVNNILKIMLEISEKRPNTKIYLQSIYPVNKDDDDKRISPKAVGERNNDRIKKINKELKKICLSNICEYIDLYDLLANEEGNLKVKYTQEGLHITEEGYEVITKKIKEVIENK